MSDERRATLYRADAAIVGMTVECPFCEEDTVEIETGSAGATCDNDECGAKFGVDDTGFLGLVSLKVRVEGVKR
jgi:hypothetical protein